MVLVSFASLMLFSVGVVQIASLPTGAITHILGPPPLLAVHDIETTRNERSLNNDNIQIVHPGNRSRNQWLELIRPARVYHATISSQNLDITENGSPLLMPKIFGETRSFLPPKFPRGNIYHEIWQRIEVPKEEPIWVNDFDDPLFDVPYQNYFPGPGESINSPQYVERTLKQLFELPFQRDDINRIIGAIKFSYYYEKHDTPNQGNEQATTSTTTTTTEASIGKIGAFDIDPTKNPGVGDKNENKNGTVSDQGAKNKTQDGSTTEPDQKKNTSESDKDNESSSTTPSSVDKDQTPGTSTPKTDKNENNKVNNTSTTTPVNEDKSHKDDNEDKKDGTEETTTSKTDKNENDKDNKSSITTPATVGKHHEDGNEEKKDRTEETTTSKTDKNENDKDDKSSVTADKPHKEDNEGTEDGTQENTTSETDHQKNTNENGNDNKASTSSQDNNGPKITDSNTGSNNGGSGISLPGVSTGGVVGTIITGTGVIAGAGNAATGVATGVGGVGGAGGAGGAGSTGSSGTQSQSVSNNQRPQNNNNSNKNNNNDNRKPEEKPKDNKPKEEKNKNKQEKDDDLDFDLDELEDLFTDENQFAVKQHTKEDISELFIEKFKRLDSVYEWFRTNFTKESGNLTEFQNKYESMASEVEDMRAKLGKQIEAEPSDDVYNEKVELFNESYMLAGLLNTFYDNVASINSTLIAFVDAIEYLELEEYVFKYNITEIVLGAEGIHHEIYRDIGSVRMVAKTAQFRLIDCFSAPLVAFQNWRASIKRSYLSGIELAKKTYLLLLKEKAYEPNNWSQAIDNLNIYIQSSKQHANLTQSFVDSEQTTLDCVYNVTNYMYAKQGPILTKIYDHTY